MATRREYFVSVLLISLLIADYASARNKIKAIQEVSKTEWRQKTAAKEIKKDVLSFLEAYDKARPELLSVLEAFLNTRVKDVGVRKLAAWGIALGNLHELSASEDVKKAIADRLIDVNALLLQGYEKEFSYVEQARLRGWPMIVDPRDHKLSFEGFNFGAIGISISKAAQAAASHGRHKLAAEMLTPVLAALYDGFLTEDIEKTKLDRKGRVVYVPKGASKQRKKRHIEIARQETCLDIPQAYNHGLLVARAAMAASYAIDEINWEKADWSMGEWTREECTEKLTWLIKKNAKWLRKGMREPEPTGSSPRDMYPGAAGTSWFQWNYRDLSRCKALKGTYKDRPEDIAHATHETKFVREFRDWASRQETSEKYLSVFDKDDVRKMIVTFLNRIVYDYEGDGSHRFACDVDGTNDYHDTGDPWKQCSGSRGIDVRAAVAPGWLVLASSVKDDMQKDKDLRCDALLMMKTVLPLSLSGNDDFDGQNFKGLTPKWASEIIEAKYNFYNFQQLYEKDCQQ